MRRKQSVLCLLQIISLAVGQNLLDNSGMEDNWYSFDLNGQIKGSLPSGWGDNTDWDPNSAITYSKDSTTRYAGTSSMKATISKGRMQFIQEVSLRPGTYRLSIWARGQRAAGSCSELTAAINLVLPVDPYPSYGAVTDVLGSQWTQLVSPVAEIPGGPTDPSVRFYFMVSLNQPGTIWLDNAELYVTDSTDSQEMLGNPGMEAGGWPAVYLNGGKITGNLPAGWADYSGQDPKAQISYSKDFTFPQFGSSSVRAVIAGGSMRLGQRVQLSPGSVYRLGIWVRGQPPAGSSTSLQATLALRLEASPFTVYASATTKLGQQWTNLIVQPFELPGQPTDPSLTGLFIILVDQPGTVWLDFAQLSLVELLPNPSLEDGEGWASFSSNGCKISGVLPTGWADNSEWDSGVRLVYYKDTSRPLFGSSSLKGVITSGFAQLVSRVDMLPSAAYRLSIWIRGQAPAGSNILFMAELALMLKDEPYTTYGSRIVEIGPQWSLLELRLVQLPGRPTDALIPCVFLLKVSQPGTFWLDHAHMAPVGPSLPTFSLKPPANTPVPRSFFCMHNFQHYEEGIAFDWPVLDFGVYRTWDSGIIWATIQPEGRGKFDWRWLDQDVDNALKRGIKVLMTLGQTPTWASSRPTEPVAYGDGYGAPPRDIGDWKEFIKAVALRYKGKIHAYEVWNEPNLSGPMGFFTGTPEDLAPLGRAAAEVLSQYDPAAILFTPAMTSGVNSLAWLDRYLLATKNPRLHGGVSIHLYNQIAEQDINGMAGLQMLLKKHGIKDLPIWHTEIGYNLKLRGASAQLAIAFLARSFVVNWALGVRIACWYTYNAYVLYATFEGLVKVIGEGQTDPKVLNDAGKAYRQVQLWLISAKMTSLSSNAVGVWVAELQRPAGSSPRKSWVVWSVATATSFAIPASWKASYQQNLVTGKNTSVGATVGVGPTPVLVVSSTV